MKRKNFVIVLSLGFVLVLVLSVVIFSLLGSLSLHKKQHAVLCVHYDKQRRIIAVTCDSTLSEANMAIANDSILRKETTEGVWLLSSSIIISKGATLTIDPDDANWLRINSEVKPNLNELTPYHIQVFGALDLHGVKITSWNPKTFDYANQTPDGIIPRPYITVEEGSDRSDIANSEIGYLGYNSPRKKGFNFYGGDNSTLRGNRIHDLWYGLFSTNVGNMLIENNLVYNNFKYGIDPHKGSHDMLIKNNHIYNNRIGLICSLDCSNIIFEKNTIKNNNEIGLMFSRNTVNSTARFNNISLSDIGITVSESHSNEIYGNSISKNIDGLAVKNNSSDTFLLNNTIIDSTHCGMVFAFGAHNNTIRENYIHNYKGSGICLSNGANQNAFDSNEIDGLGQYGINVKDGDVISNRFQDNVILLAKNAIRVYNNTGTLFINNSIHNTLTHQYIISGNSTLNLEETRFLGDAIRSAGTDTNTLKISNSGIVDVLTKQTGSNGTKTSRYYTDMKPYNANLSSLTIRVYSKH
jgi:mannuronan 5-epimerase